MLFRCDNYVCSMIFIQLFLRLFFCYCHFYGLFVLFVFILFVFRIELNFIVAIDFTASNGIFFLFSFSFFPFWIKKKNITFFHSHLGTSLVQFRFIHLHNFSIYSNSFASYCKQPVLTKLKIWNTGTTFSLNPENMAIDRSFKTNFWNQQIY